MENNLRRTRKKLDILENTEGISWVIHDLLNNVEGREIDKHTLNYMISSLKREYLLYIQENEKKELKQKKIEFNDGQSI